MGGDLSRLGTISTIACVALVATPLTAWGSPPSASNSTVPRIIRVVGAAGEIGDAAAGMFTVVARTLANNPINGASIVVDFSGCPDVVVCGNQLDPGALVDCGRKSVRKWTDLTGAVSFTILGGSTGAGTASTLGGAGKVFANGTLIGTPSVAVFDLDGAAGVGTGDLSVWLGDFASGTVWSRSNYDGDGALGAGDLALWLDEFASGASAQSCAATCP